MTNLVTSWFKYKELVDSYLKGVREEVGFDAPAAYAN